jgi:hypothetical protein
MALPNSIGFLPGVRVIAEKLNQMVRGNAKQLSCIGHAAQAGVKHIQCDGHQNRIVRISFAHSKPPGMSDSRYPFRRRAKGRSIYWRSYAHRDCLAKTPQSEWAVFQLRPAVFRNGSNARWNVADAHCRLDFVPVLTTGTTGSICVHFTFGK